MTSLSEKVKSNMTSMAGLTPKKTHLKDINFILICPLCNGYLIDATTVVECSHSFCRSCILKHLHKDAKCPCCKHLLNTAKPNIKVDKALQDIVYKLVPGLYQKEMRRRREFYSKHPDQADATTPEQRGEDVSGRLIFAPEDAISLSLEYIPPDVDVSTFLNTSTDPDSMYPSKVKENGINSMLKRYLQCPALVTIAHLKKFLVMKFNVDVTKFNVDICHRSVPLPEHWTLMDVAYTFSWKRNAPIRFFYTITQELSQLEVSLNERLCMLPGKTDTQAPITQETVENENNNNAKEKLDEAKEKIEPSKDAEVKIEKKDIPKLLDEKHSEVKTSKTNMRIPIENNATKQVKSPLKILKSPDGHYQIKRSPTMTAKENINEKSPSPPLAQPAEFSVVSMDNERVKITLKQCSPGSNSANSKKPKVLSNILLGKTNSAYEQENHKSDKHKRKSSFAENERKSQSPKKPVEQSEKKDFFNNFKLTTKQTQNNKLNGLDNTNSKKENELIKVNTSPKMVNGCVNNINNAQLNAEQTKALPAESKVNSNNIAVRLNSFKSLAESPETNNKNGAHPIDVYTFPSDPPAVVPPQTISGAQKRKCPPGVPIRQIKKNSGGMTWDELCKRQQLAANKKEEPSPPINKLKIIRKNAGAMASVQIPRDEWLRRQQLIVSKKENGPEESKNREDSLSQNESAEPSIKNKLPILNQALRLGSASPLEIKWRQSLINKDFDQEKDHTTSANETKFMNPLPLPSYDELRRKHLNATEEESAASKNSLKCYRNPALKQIASPKSLETQRIPMPNLHPAMSINSQVSTATAAVSSTSPKNLNPTTMTENTRNLLDGCGLNIPASLSITLTAPKSPNLGSDPPLEIKNNEQNSIEKLNPSITLNDKSVDPGVLKAIKSGKMHMPNVSIKSKIAPKNKASQDMEMGPPSKRKKIDSFQNMLNYSNIKKMEKEAIKIPTPGKYKVPKSKANWPSPIKSEASDSGIFASNGQIVTIPGGQKYYRTAPGCRTPSVSRISDIPIAPTRTPVYASSFAFPMLHNLITLNQSPSLEQFATGFRLPTPKEFPTSTGNVSIKSHIAAQCPPIKPARSMAPPAVKLNGIYPKVPLLNNINKVNSLPVSESETSTTTKDVNAEQTTNKTTENSEALTKSQVETCETAPEGKNPQHGSASPRVSSTAPSPPPTLNESTKDTEKPRQSDNNNTSSGSEVTSTKSPESPDSSSALTETTGNLVDSTKMCMEKNDSNSEKGTEIKPVEDEKTKETKKINETSLNEKKTNETSEALRKQFLAAVQTNEWANNPVAAENLTNILKNFSSIQGDVQS